MFPYFALGYRLPLIIHYVFLILYIFLIVYPQKIDPMIEYFVVIKIELHKN